MATQSNQPQPAKAAAPVKQPTATANAQTPSVPAPVAAALQAAKTPKKTPKKFPKLDWLFFLAVFFVLGQISLLFVLHTTKQTYRALKQEDADRIYVLQKATTVSQEDINELEKSFLREDDIITFIQSIESAEGIFSDFNFRFTSDTPQGKDNQFLSFSIEAVGTKENIRLFIDTLLSSTYAVEATKIDIIAADDDLESGQMSMTGNVYIQVLKK